MNKLRLVKKIIILALILALPGFLYYLLTAQGKNRYKPLPIFGPKQLAKTFHKVHGKAIPDTIYHTLNDFDLKDQNGRVVSFKTFGKKIVVINFFYTHCPTLCNQINGNVDSLAENYKKNKLVSFASITVDPERDSATVLKDYSKKFMSLPNRLFLTGDTTSIYNLARKGLLVDALKADKDNFIYSNKLILIDSEKRIRGYYSGILTDDLVRMNDEIKVLITEELRKNDKPLY
jgi:protein SCO1/2